MKIILTGATGYVGTEILDQAVAHKYIEHIYCITRKPLDRKYFAKAAKGKVTELIHENFGNYDDSLMKFLRDAGVEGCIWCMGPKTHPDMAKRVREGKAFDNVPDWGRLYGAEGVDPALGYTDYKAAV